MNERQQLLFGRQFEDIRSGCLDELFAEPAARLRRGKVFSLQPDPIDVTRLLREQRIEGMLWGVAVGDALGHSTEFGFDPKTRRERFGTIVDHLTAGDRRVGSISDDAQMTFWTVESLLDRGKFDLEDLTHRFVDRHDWIVGRGSNTSASLMRHQRRLKGEQLTVVECAGDARSEGRGNGGLMRFSPIVLPHLASPSERLWSDAAMSTLITHGNTVALSAAVAMTGLLWDQLRKPADDRSEPEWWIDRYLALASDLETERLPSPLNTDPLPRWYSEFRGTLCDFLDGPVRRVFRKGVSLRDACSLDGFGSRADCTQTVPAVLYIMMCHGDSFESAVIAAVNDTKDNDTIAAIVGALAGARHGLPAIRRRWIDGIRSSCLTNTREAESDRVRMERLITMIAAKVAG